MHRSEKSVQKRLHYLHNREIFLIYIRPDSQECGEAGNAVLGQLEVLEGDHRARLGRLLVRAHRFDQTLADFEARPGT